MADARDQIEIRKGEYLKELLRSDIRPGSDINSFPNIINSFPDKRTLFDKVRIHCKEGHDESLLAECADFMDIVRLQGMQGFYTELLRRLSEWRTITLNIGVIGASGVGKSTFINTLRNLKPTDPLGAPTGVVQTTKKPTPYKHPKNPNVKIWDLPGVGTVEFPRNDYLEKIEFTKYDFFVIICCSRFTEDDLWFAHQVKEAEKRFYFVRTKIDNDVRSDKEDYGEEHNMEKLLLDIREDCTKHLSDAHFEDPLVFLISKNPTKYDFNTLQEQLLTDLPELKRETALLTLQTASKKIIMMKTKQLMTRTRYLAISFAVLSLSNSSDLLLKANVELIMKELTLCREVYGLHEDCLKVLSDAANMSRELLVAEIKHHFWMDLNMDAVMKELEKYNDELYTPEKKMAKSDDNKTAIRVVKLSSRHLTTALVNNAIRNMECAALTVLNLALSNASSRGA